MSLMTITLNIQIIHTSWHENKHYYPTRTDG